MKIIDHRHGGGLVQKGSLPYQHCGFEYNGRYYVSSYIEGNARFNCFDLEGGGMSFVDTKALVLPIKVEVHVFKNAQEEN